MNFPADGHPVERIELVPNCSLSTRGAVTFFGMLCLVTLGIAMLFLVQGYWPVLPFAGLELALLGWAVCSNLERRYWRERIEVSDDEIVIETTKRGDLTRIVFSRHWARIRIRSPSYALHSRRLVIESHGRAVEVGAFLNEEERRRLAARLVRVVGNTNESPSLT